MLGQGQETTLCQFAHLTRPGKAVTTLAVGSQEQKLWAWQEGRREAAAATLCKGGKDLSKGFHCQPVSHMPESSFQLEAKAYHQPDSSQISPATRQTLRTKIAPVLSRLTPSTGRGPGAPGMGSAQPLPPEHLSGALLWVSSHVVRS